MAFTAGLKAPRQFSGANSNNNQNTFDRLVTVKDYDISKAYMYVEDDKGKKYEVFVNPEQVRSANAASQEKGTDLTTVNWMGHSIDEKMKKAIPVGSKVILIRSKVVQKDQTRDLSQTEVHRIVGVPNPKADKTFQGLFTMTYRMEDGKERISHAQNWDYNGIDINDTAALEELKAKMDKARANYGKKVGEYTVTEPTIGVQFRSLMETSEKYEYEKDPTKNTIYDAVDFSLPFDWMPGPEDENGKEIKSQAHVITGDEMMAFAEQYAEYIQNHESFKNHLDKMLVEVCFFHVYPASKNNNLALTFGVPKKDQHADKNPLYQLSHRKSFIDIAQTESITGKNAAVNGIIQISDNKLIEIDDVPTKIPSYWVSKIHANNARGHVHAFIRTANGNKVRPVEQLALIKNEVAAGSNAGSSSGNGGNGGNSGSAGGNSGVSANVAVTTSKAAPVVPEVNDFDPFDPFGSEEAAPAVATRAAPKFGQPKE